jgi:pyruvate formate lyase activating enzyme
MCPHHCALEENQIGLCRARSNKNGSITAINYGLVTAIALDPIEKKPLNRFHPGSNILSVGSFGCNFKCQFCQNHEISMAGIKQAQTQTISPQELVSSALSLRYQGNIGIAYTYNEPLVGYEFVRDCAEEARRKTDLKNVLVTNGCFCEQPLKELLPLIDALNIDLKAFTKEFYRKIGGNLETVKRAIELSAQQSHVEVTTLIIPGENDSEDEIRSLSGWLSSIRADIPLHLTRFYPRYNMLDRKPTDISKINVLAKIAREALQYVYV